MPKGKDNLSIKNLTSGRHPRLPFSNIKNAVLGKSYELSVVFCGNALSYKLNKIYREKNKPTNVLSFSISKNEGEIFINLPLIKKECELLKTENFKLKILHLLIHGMLHLKGMRHGAKMDKQEARFIKKFGNNK